MENISTTDWQAIVAFAYVLYGLVGGVATVPLIARLKERFNLDGRKAQIATVAVTVVVAAVGLVAGGVISPEPLTFAHVMELLTLLLVASQAEYQRIKSKQT